MDFFDSIFRSITDFLSTALTDLQTASGIVLEMVTSFFHDIAEMIRSLFNYLGL